MAKPNPIADLKQRVKALGGQVRLVHPFVEEARVLKERMDSQAQQDLKRKEVEYVGESNDIKELKARLELKERELRETQAAMEKLKEESERRYQEQLTIVRQELEEEWEMLRQVEESNEEAVRVLRVERKANGKILKKMLRGQQTAARYRKEAKFISQELERERKMRRQMKESKEEPQRDLQGLLIAELKKMQAERQLQARYREQVTNIIQELEAKRKMRHQMKEEPKAAAEPRAGLEEQRDNEGRTQLHRAADQGDTDRVLELLEAGSQVNAQDGEGCTPLYLAAEQGHQEACRALLAAGAQLDVKGGPSGCTALHVAAWSGYRAVCELLLGAGARPNEPGNNSHWTALHYAACNGQAPVVQLLLQHGAERGMRDGYGHTPLDVAHARKFTGVVDLLQG